MWTQSCPYKVENLMKESKSSLSSQCAELSTIFDIGDKIKHEARQISTLIDNYFNGKEM